MSKAKKQVNSFNVTIENEKYDIDIVSNESNKYECTVLLYNHAIETVRTIDRFKIVNTKGEFWAWTGELLTQVEKRIMRETITYMLNSKELILTA